MSFKGSKNLFNLYINVMPVNRQFKSSVTEYYTNHIAFAKEAVRER
jgi:hypothetical protein